MCPTKTCYAAHVLEPLWPYGHIWRTAKCQYCHKLVDAQTPHPNPSRTDGAKGGNENSWLTLCLGCDVYSVIPQTPVEIECLKKNTEKC